MKIINLLFSMLILVSCASSKETNYTGSTPAGPVVRAFLGIPLADSIDFIRWKISFNEHRYTLACNYGIGQPNTNGFIHGGKTIQVSGGLEKEENIYLLQNDGRSLKFAELNSDLLHILDADNNLLAGNGGWSYTINNMSPSVTDVINLKPVRTILKDSMAFEGRTPCAVPGIIEPGKLCYKLKWYIVLYADAVNNQPTTYKVFGTGWRREGGIRGNWKIMPGKDGRIRYLLYDDAGNPFITLLKPGENILLFTDTNGKLLVGDLDFSYTLNKL